MINPTETKVCDCCAMQDTCDQGLLLASQGAGLPVVKTGKAMEAVDSQWLGLWLYI